MVPYTKDRQGTPEHKVTMTVYKFDQPGDSEDPPKLPGIVTKFLLGEIHPKIRFNGFGFHQEEIKDLLQKSGSASQERIGAMSRVCRDVANYANAFFTKVNTTPKTGAQVLGAIRVCRIRARALVEALDWIERAALHTQIPCEAFVKSQFRSFV